MRRRPSPRQPRITPPTRFVAQTPRHPRAAARSDERVAVTVSPVTAADAMKRRVARGQILYDAPEGRHADAGADQTTATPMPPAPTPSTPCSVAVGAAVCLLVAGRARAGQLLDRLDDRCR